MLKINRLYTIPEVIEPITFNEGLNYILGERDDSSNKTNGVGKSLCIEFINFALLKKKSESRVALIPEDDFSPDTYICVDFSLYDEEYTIKRSLNEAEMPIIIQGNEEVKFNKLDDAIKFLTERLFKNSQSSYPSFRSILGLLIRDERSEFKSITSFYDTKKRIADDYAPHLFLFNINIDLYKEVKECINQVDDLSTSLTKISKNLQSVTNKNIKNIKADINELKNQVDSIEDSIDKLENIEGYEIIKDDLIRLENQIEKYRVKKITLEEQILKLEPISHKVNITTNEVAEFYEQLKEGLGNLISKDLTEVLDFKRKIDEFQNHLLKEKQSQLAEKVDSLNKIIFDLDKQYKKNLQVLDKEGGLKNLKQTYSALKEKSDELNQLNTIITKYEFTESELQKYKSKKESSLFELQSDIHSRKNIIDNFEETILWIHEFIQGNKKASFEIKTVNKKQIIEINLRIDDDGSHSIEREKVFIYDISLLLNSFTQLNHPGFLVHDNIFEVDEDTFEKNIQFLEEKAFFNKQQYILTLTSDRLASGSISSNFVLKHKIDSHVRAIFTKQNRFLKRKYQEKR
ncbi:DUF2326 domain-containing protein [Legionella qingyii]|uniref:DUF2326 domain-containing protein n=1 Tax=Legionella qingyii TaxID=2184757 RepID=UPI000F8CFBC3|nr:DUF2326 domain-containing protein [Legionella qingyii]RUR24263.1 DUF2326 domain-containing protein [Legionella qingyii]